MTPKYVQIYKEIKHRILNGYYKENNHQLPTEADFCKEFSCSRMTIKKALDYLVSEGYIYRKKGKGSFVFPNKKLSSKISIHENQLSGLSKFYKGEVSSKVIKFEFIFADETLADKLDLNVGDPVYHIFRLRLVDQKPFVLECTYINPIIIPGITQDVLNHSVYDYIENTLHLKIAGSFRITRADCSNESDQKYLELTEKEPVLEVEQLAYLDNGFPFEYSFARHRYDCFEFYSHSIITQNPF